MNLRRVITAASTIVVAIALAVIVPIAQLPTTADVSACCCPDPDKCKCADHDDPSQQPLLKACHNKGPDGVQVQLPAFVAPALVALDQPVLVLPAAPIALADPHPAPTPRRPDAPS